jgi:hypothetical protein
MASRETPLKCAQNPIETKKSPPGANPEGLSKTLAVVN